MKKKLIALLLAATMVSGIVGCGGGDSTKPADGNNDQTEDQGDTQEPENAGAEADEGADGDNTLTIWGWDPNFTFVSLQEAERIYAQDHPGFKLNLIEMTWPDVQAKITTAVTSGELDTLPDVLLLQDGAYQKNILSYPELFEDLTDCGINFDEFSPGKVGMSTVDGKHYGVPFDSGTSIAGYRTDLLEQAGLTVDDFTDITWSQFIENGKKVKEATGKPMLSMTSKEPDLVMEMMQSAGLSLFNEDGSVNMVDNEALKEALEIYKTLVDEGIVMITNDWNGYVESFTRGDVAAVLNGCWILASVQVAEDQSGKWAITNIPKLEKTANATNYTSNGGSSWGVNAASSKKELATDFLKSTWAGSAEMFDNILPKTGCLSTWLPAGESDVYAQPQEFYGGDAIYQKIVEFGAKVPACVTGKYYYEAREALGTAISNIENGADIAEELKTAQETAEFSIGE